MRHLYGIALASIMTLVMFFAGAWGYERLLRLPAPADSSPAALPADGGSLLSSSAVLYALAAVAVTGVLAGILVAVPRVSPLAAGLPGLLLIGWTALYLHSVHVATDLIPLKSYAFGAGWEALLFNGILAAVGLAMIVPLFIPSRWRLRQDSQLPGLAGPPRCACCGDPVLLPACSGRRYGCGLPRDAGREPIPTGATSRDGRDRGGVAGVRPDTRPPGRATTAPV